ncbi:hypothetical protein ACVW07_000822 [Cellulomonas sp. URHB0016]
MTLAAGGARPVPDRPGAAPFGPAPTSTARRPTIARRLDRITPERQSPTTRVAGPRVGVRHVQHDPTREMSDS